jgi:predicted deacylase
MRLARPARAGITLILAAALLGAQEEPTPQVGAPPAPVQPADEPLASEPDATAAALAPQPEPAESPPLKPLPPEPKPLPAFPILGKEVPPGQKLEVFLPIADEIGGRGAPVSVSHGTKPGPVLCIAGGIHGDELNGVEIARSLMHTTDPAALRGTLVVLPIVNLYGFRRGTRYLADRRDLNRFFPGRRRGSLASRVAHAVFDGVIRHCDALVDLHSGSFHRTNLPQVRANLNDPATLDLAMAFGTGIVVHNPGLSGTLRRAAADAGIPAITYEAGESMRFQRAEIDRGVDGLERLIAHIGLIGSDPEPASAQPEGPVIAAPPPAEPEVRSPAELYWSSRWVRVDASGILLANVALGDLVKEGDLLGTVTDPLSNHSNQIFAPRGGRVIGMAVDQIVVPGFAAFHVASEQRQSGAEDSDDPEPTIDLDAPAVELGPDAGE